MNDSRSGERANPRQAFAVAAVAFVIAGTARADSIDTVLQRLQQTLQNQKSGTVLVVVRQDSRNLSGAESIVASDQLAERLLTICGAAGHKGVLPVGEFGELGTVSAVPQPGNVRRLLAHERADLVVVGVWQQKKGIREIRLSLLSERKVIRSCYTALR